MCENILSMNYPAGALSLKCVTWSRGSSHQFAKPKTSSVTLSVAG